MNYYRKEIIIAYKKIKNLRTKNKQRDWENGTITENKKKYRDERKRYRENVRENRLKRKKRSRTKERKKEKKKAVEKVIGKGGEKKFGETEL